MILDIIEHVASLLGNDALLSECATAKQQQQAYQMSSEMQKLLYFVNSVNAELARHYFPLSFTNAVETDVNGKIMVNSLQRKPFEIKSVEDCLGNTFSYELFPTYLQLRKPNTMVLVTYFALPETCESVLEDVECDLRVTEKLLAYGTAAEYAMSKVLSEEAEIFQTKFLSLIDFAKQKFKIAKMRMRDWV